MKTVAGRVQLYRAFLNPPRKWLRVADGYGGGISTLISPSQAIRLAAQLQRWALGLKRGRK